MLVGGWCGGGAGVEIEDGRDAGGGAAVGCVEGDVQGGERVEAAELGFEGCDRGVDARVGQCGAGIGGDVYG